MACQARDKVPKGSAFARGQGGLARAFQHIEKQSILSTVMPASDETVMPSLEADCTRCAALCCVAPAFDRAQGFPIDKPNGVPCPHLDGGDRCRIYAEREAQGFGGCNLFDCHGAGQRVTQEVFASRSWRDDPSLMPAMVRAFFAMCRVHDLLVLLRQARKIQLGADEARTLNRFQDELTPEDGWTVETLDAFERDRRAAEIEAFLKSLRYHFA